MHTLLSNEDEGLPWVLGNKGTLAKYRGKQGNMNPFLGNRGTKLYKLEDENMVSKFIERGTNKENMWEHGTIGQFWKGTKTPHGRPAKMRERKDDPRVEGICIIFLSNISKGSAFLHQGVTKCDPRKLVRYNNYLNKEFVM